MSGWTRLSSEIVASSIWSEDKDTRILWITMLAMKDKDGFVSAALPGLAAFARLSLEECQAAVSKLEAPDPWSRSTEHEGRRIKKTEGGWMVLNHFKYRDSLSDSPEAVASRERMRKMRSKDRSVTDSVTLRNVTERSRNVVSVSVSASESSSSPEGDARGGKGRVKANTELEVRINRWLRRRETTLWTVKERRLLSAISPIPEEDLALVEWFYMESKPIEGGYHPKRTGLEALLNGWTDEVSKVRNFKDRSQFGEVGFVHLKGI